MSNKFHYLRDRLIGGKSLHDRWGKIDACRETFRRGGEVHTLVLGDPCSRHVYARFPS